MTLYRQYRPLQFKDLIGQETPTTLLQQALLKQRIAHAYLFSGPRGTGKTSSARIYARALCCQNPQQTETTFEPCGVCDSCQLILHNQATDLLEIDAASNRGIEDIRTLREQVQYPPAQLTYRIYIIDECHMLTGDAFNALLKTLEEPPSHCIFILATTELHKVPLTVRSRCQLVRFERGSVKAITTKLDAIIADNTWNVEPGVSTIVAEHADGSFRDAETTLEQLTTTHTNLTLATTLVTLGTVPITACAILLQACLAQDMEAVQQALQDTFSDQSLRFSWVIGELIKQLRQQGISTPLHVFALQQFLEAAILQKNTPLQSLPLEIACYAIAGHGQAEARLEPKSTPTRHTVALPSIATIITAEPEKNTSMDKVKIVIPAPEPLPERVPVVELRDATHVDIRKAWKAAVDDITPLNLPLAQMLKGTLLHMVEGQTIIIYVRYKFHLEKLSERRNRELVQDQLAKHNTENWQISFVLNPSIPKHEPKKQVTSTSLGAHDVSEVFTEANPA